MQCLKIIDPVNNKNSFAFKKWWEKRKSPKMPCYALLKSPKIPFFIMLRKHFLVSILIFSFSFVCSSEDINRQLPVESKRYQTMERIWKKFMSTAYANPQVISLCSDARLLDNMKECNKLLEQVSVFQFLEYINYLNRFSLHQCS